MMIKFITIHLITNCLLRRSILNILLKCSWMWNIPTSSSWSILLTRSCPLIWLFLSLPISRCSLYQKSLLYTVLLEFNLLRREYKSTIVSSLRLNSCIRTFRKTRLQLQVLSLEESTILTVLRVTTHICFCCSSSCQVWVPNNRILSRNIKRCWSWRVK